MKPIFRLIEKEKENPSFKLKLSGLLDSFLIPLDRSSLFSCCFLFLHDSSRLIGFQIFKTKGIRSNFFKSLFFLSL